MTSRERAIAASQDKSIILMPTALVLVGAILVVIAVMQSLI